MKDKNVTIFGLGAIGGFIGGNVFAFYKMLHSKRIRKALTDDGYKISLPKVLVLN